MLGYGVSRPGGKKNDKFENALIENEKLLESILKKRQFKETYSTINANTLSSITLDTHPTFLALKAEIESFNQEIKDALTAKAEIPNYNWKQSLYVGLRNLLKEIVSTEDKNLKEIFLEKAKFWFYDRLEKKGEGDTKIASRPQTNQSLRPITAGTRPFTAMTRPFTSQTNRLSDINQASINETFIPPEGESIMKGKSFFEDTRDEILPSRLRANILKDYEDGARSKHDLVEPPYERLSEYERKIPQGILKPSSRAGHRPQTSSKVTTFAQNANFKFFMDKTAPQGTLPSGGQTFHDGMSQLEGSHKSQEDEGEGEVEGEEGEGEDGILGAEQPVADNGERKPGIVVPARKLYLSDKITASQHKMKDLNIPIETRSNFAHYVPSNTLSELKLEQRWRNAMHKKTSEKREKEEFVTLMKEWAHTKSRLEEEVSRKNESISYGSRFQQRTFIPRAKSANLSSALPKRFSVENGSGKPVQDEEEEDLDIRNEDEISETSQENEMDTPAEVGKITVYRETGNKKAGQPELYDFSKIRPKSVATGQELAIIHTEPIEDIMNKAKIEKITRLHADLLFATRGVPVDVGQDGAYSVDRPKSLSIYDQNKKQMYRPFSAVHQVARPENFRKGQMQEIEEIKTKLAKFKIKVPVKQLKTSLLLPEVTQASNPQLPIPGAGLLINPFFKEKKGKKKGGKKKKR